jgi:hypothetical protein
MDETQIAILERYSTKEEHGKSAMRDIYPEMSRAFDAIDYAEKKALKVFSKDLQKVSETIQKIATV